MFIYKLLKNQKHVEPVVYMTMKEIDTDAQKNNNTMIIINDQVDTTNDQNQSSVNDQLNLQSNEIENMNVQGATLIVENGGHGNNSLPKKDRRIVEKFAHGDNSRTTSSIREAKDHYDPLLEYAEEPLLPLSMACAPLTDIVHNLSAYVRLALDETLDEPADGLTVDESAAIRLYTIEWQEAHPSLYSMLNVALKNSDRHALRPYYKYLKLLLTGLVKVPCAPVQTVWRGVTKDLSNDFQQGSPVIWWTFSSCTTSLTVLANSMYLGNVGERTLFSVETINGRRLRDHSHYDYEDEILLLPGTYMEVQSQLSPATDLNIIHLKQIKPIDTLLELPFEGALLYSPEKKKVSWYKKKRTIGELTLLISLCFAGIIVGSILGTRRSPPPRICRTRTPGISSDLFWSFDCGDAREELTGLYNGSGENGANYSSPDFSGQGKALYLNQKLNQYVTLPRPLNLGLNTSFTVSAWILSTGYNWATILSDCNPLNSVCIELFVWSTSIYAQTYNWNDESHTQWIEGIAWKINYQSCWIHLVFLFDNQSNILSIYFNGDRIVNASFIPSSFATTQTNKSVTSYIGSRAISTNRNPFDGLIDQLSISYYVKNDSEILDEATLLCQYKFESDDINVDSGPNNIRAYSENVYRSMSNNESNLLFNSSDSYFQSSGFTLLMSKIYEFTIAFWLRPIIIQSNQSNSSIAVLQLASKVQQITSESYVCFLCLLIANITTDNPYFRVNYGQLNMYAPLDGYVVKNNTWIHFAVSYSNGIHMSFCLDGRYCTSLDDSRFPLLIYNPRLAITIGGNYFDDQITTKPSNYDSRKCFAENPDFTYTQMSGEIDELNILARALSNSELATLANSTNKTT